jgi:hypothetical protein
MKPPLPVLDYDEFRAVENRMQEMAGFVRRRIPKSWGFTVLCFEYGGGAMTYISSAERATMVKALRECADTLEARADGPPGIGGRVQ